VERSYEEAARLYALSAEQGNAFSQFSLGYMYEKGIGVEASMERAMELYRSAAKQGDKNAIAALERLEGPVT
jgi:hypothetical protein